MFTMLPLGGGKRESILSALHVCCPVAFLLLLLAVQVPKSSNACSPIPGARPKSLTEKVLLASELLYGRVLRTFPDPRFDYGSGSTAYTAEMEIFCIMKGKQTERLVNITEAGYIAGLCHSSNLIVGNDYIIMAHVDKDDGKYRITTMQIDVTEENLRNITLACGLQRVYPIGIVQETAVVQCPLLPRTPTCKTKEDFPPVIPKDYDEYDLELNLQPPATQTLPTVAPYREGKRFRANSLRGVQRPRCHRGRSCRQRSKTMDHSINSSTVSGNEQLIAGPGEPMGNRYEVAEHGSRSRSLTRRRHRRTTRTTLAPPQPTEEAL